MDYGRPSSAAAGLAAASGDGAQGAPVPGLPRLLAVEDNADTRILLQHLLRKAYEVTCVANGDDALEAARHTGYDVVLLDINLGKGKGGEQVLQHLRADARHVDVPVIAVTAYAMPGDRERFLEAGFTDYVSKPFSKQRLLEALAAAAG